MEISSLTLPTILFPQGLLALYKTKPFSLIRPNPTTPNPGRRIGIHGRGKDKKLRAVTDIEVVTVDPIQAQITWQIVIGALAGVTPFVVAGIEFSKRIVAQRKCKVCGGSGLVLREKYYFRCPGCGGFLPWQSWKRFFSG